MKRKADEKKSRWKEKQIERLEEREFEDIGRKGVKALLVDRQEWNSKEKKRA
jgi:hypothetical protein